MSFSKTLSSKFKMQSPVVDRPWGKSAPSMDLVSVPGMLLWSLLCCSDCNVRCMFVKDRQIFEFNVRKLE